MESQAFMELEIPREPDMKSLESGLDTGSPPAPAASGWLQDQRCSPHSTMTNSLLHIPIKFVAPPESWVQL